MMILLNILYFLLALGILVTFHEFGHFYIARRCGVKVLRFSVGFGRPLLTWRDSRDTEYVLAAIPLGGYVKMLDEREGNVAPEELSSAFSQKTVWQRMAIVVAGPVANFILASFLYFILALFGSTGIAPVVGELPTDGVAAQAGLKVGDEIVSVDGKSVSTWSAVFSALLHRIGETGEIVFEVQASGYLDNLLETNRPRTVRVPIERWLHSSEEPDLFNKLGVVRFLPDSDVVIDQVIKGSAADLAGLQSGDQVLSVDGGEISSWRKWVEYVRARPSIPIKLRVLRQQEDFDMFLVPESVKSEDGIDVGQAGVSAPISWPKEMVRKVEYSLFEAIWEGFSKTGETASLILSFIKKLILADVSSKNLSGSFSIAQAAGDSADAGVLYYIAFIAYLSVSLGVLNLLPIPVLDGGHLLYYVIEWAKGSPVSEKVQMIGYQIGLFCILSVMILAHVNDLLRIFS
jgi:regulator of sigma E protease